MTLFGEVLDAPAAVRAGLALRSIDGGHDELIAAARELAAPAVAAPRAVVMSTKRTMRRTSGLAEHSAAVDAELAPQLESLAAPAFAERLAALKARVSSR
jgi:enoyl-CoA hydratase